MITAAALVLALAAACGDTPGSSSTGDPSGSPEAVVMLMQRVEPGSFMLGENLGTTPTDGPLNWDAPPLTPVTLTQGFYMGRYPVTRQQWIDVMGEGIPGWSTALPNAQESAAGGDINRRPATHMSWYDAIVFANLLSMANGLAPAYEIECADNGELTTNPARWGTVPTNSGDPSRPRWDNAQIAVGSDGYRLPTNEQWEFAAKGGNTADSYTFSGSDIVGDVAWTVANSGNSPRMVGLLDANGLEIHDMSGNVWEWAQDWQGDLRVVRGGVWNLAMFSARSVSRGASYPYIRGNYTGFRLARPAH